MWKALQIIKFNRLKYILLLQKRGLEISLKTIIIIR